MTTFKQLDAFVALADTGTFSETARVLGIAQSAVSKHMLEFERDFERELLDRSRRKAQLTVDGADVLMQCRSILRRRDAMLQAMKKVPAGLQSLRIGVTELVALTWLHRFLHSIEEKSPQTTIKARVEQGEHLRQLLKSGDLDVIIVPEEANVADGVKIRTGNVESRWYCSPLIHPGSTILSVQELSTYTLLTEGAGSYSGVLLNQWIRCNCIAPRHTVTSGSLLTLLDLLVAGVGISHLPTVLANKLLEQGKILELSIKPRIQAVSYVMLMREGIVPKHKRKVTALVQEACDFNMLHRSTPWQGSMRE